MNNDRIQEILDLMEEARLDYFLISDPQSIAYCTGYYNDPVSYTHLDVYKRQVMDSKHLLN